MGEVYSVRSLLSDSIRFDSIQFNSIQSHSIPNPMHAQAMVWPETHGQLEGFAARCAAYGTAHEPVARDLYVGARAARDGDGFVALWETGLLVDVRHGWLGCSPDFVFAERTDRAPPPPLTVLVNDTVDAASVPSAIPDDVSDGVLRVACGEIKCPASGKQYHEDPKHAPTGGFPHYYFDQIQGVMALNGWPYCDVVVYTPPITTVTRFLADTHYWTQTLFPALHTFYFDEFVPRMNARLAGRLHPGQIDAVLDIPRAMVDEALFSGRVISGGGDGDDDDDDKHHHPYQQAITDLCILLHKPLACMLPV